MKSKKRRIDIERIEIASHMLSPAWHDHQRVLSLGTRCAAHRCGRYLDGAFANTITVTQNGVTVDSQPVCDFCINKFIRKSSSST